MQIKVCRGWPIFPLSRHLEMEICDLPDNFSQDDVDNHLEECEKCRSCYEDITQEMATIYEYVENKIHIVASEVYEKIKDKSSAATNAWLKI